MFTKFRLVNQSLISSARRLQSVLISEEKRTVEGVVVELFGRAGENDGSKRKFFTLSEEKIAKLLVKKQQK